MQHGEGIASSKQLFPADRAGTTVASQMETIREVTGMAEALREEGKDGDTLGLYSARKSAATLGCLAPSTAPTTTVSNIECFTNLAIST